MGAGPFGQNAIAMSLVNVPNVLLTNSTISASALITGDQDFNSSTLATGIYSNNSRLTITGGRLEAKAEVTGTNNGNNLASALGGNGVGLGLDFAGNTITISGGAVISATALVDVDNLGGTNAAVAIGNNLVNTMGSDALFRDNTLLISGSQINSSAEVLRDNIGFRDAMDINIVKNVSNLAIGIGSNSVDATNAFTQNNDFTLDQTRVISSAEIGRDNLSNTPGSQGFPTAFAFNLVAGIGGNASTATDSNTGKAGFVDNQINIRNFSEVNGQAIIDRDNRGLNFAPGLGGNSIFADASFTDNSSIRLENNSLVNGSADITGNKDLYNSATGLGGNSYRGNASFTSNVTTSLMLTDSKASGNAEVGGSSSQQNSATGLGGNSFGGNASFMGNGNNSIVLNHSTASGSAIIAASNSGGNFAAGLGGNNSSFSNNGDIKLLNDSLTEGIAKVTGDSSFNFATGLGGNSLGEDSNFSNNRSIIVDSSEIKGLAEIGGNNTQLNFATGLGGNTFFQGNASFSDNTEITLTNSVKGISGTAKANAQSEFFPGSIKNNATGIGGNFQGGNVSFNNNTQVTITGNTISATATITAGNNAENRAGGLNFDSGSLGTINVSGGKVDALASIGSGTLSEAIAFYAVSGVTVNVSMANSTITATQDASPGLCQSGGGSFSGIVPANQNCS